jgi:hypothetical protein
MAGKLTLLIGMGAGYVLGARSGRERYDQIVQKAQELWRDPRVQEKAEQAQQLVKDKASGSGSVSSDQASGPSPVSSSTAFGSDPLSSGTTFGTDPATHPPGAPS